MHKKLLAAVVIVAAIFSATHLPNVDEVLEQVPTAVRSATN
jgi:hypothetical protein